MGYGQCVCSQVHRSSHHTGHQPGHHDPCALTWVEALGICQSSWRNSWRNFCISLKPLKLDGISGSTMLFSKAELCLHIRLLKACVISSSILDKSTQRVPSSPDPPKPLPRVPTFNCSLQAGGGHCCCAVDRKIRRTIEIKR